MGVTPQQFAELQRRVASPGRRVSTKLEEAVPASPSRAKVILGVDPSLRGTGWGIVKAATPHPVAAGFGTIRCPAGWARSRCLLHILHSLRDVLRSHPAEVCAIESLFFAQNLQTAIIMGEARGAALAAIAEAGLEIYEVAPRKVKQAMVGYGAAQKHAVARMVQRFLCLPTTPEADAADALALALTFLREGSRYSLGQPKRV